MLPPAVTPLHSPTLFNKRSAAQHLHPSISPNTHHLPIHPAPHLTAETHNSYGTLPATANFNPLGSRLRLGLHSSNHAHKLPAS